MPRCSEDPELIALPPEWLRYWRGGIGRLVPGPVVRVLLDRFAVDPEDFDRFVLEDGDPRVAGRLAPASTLPGSDDDKSGRAAAEQQQRKSKGF